MPPRRPADAELLDDVRARLVRVEETLSQMQATLARVEAAEEQQRRLANEHTLEHERIGARLTSLENTRARGEGAVWAGRVIWTLVAAAAAVGGWLLRHLGGVER
jgi:hypothetical protein